MVLVESLASGLGIIAPSPGSASEIVGASSGSEWLFATGSRVALVSALNRITDAEQCDHAGLAARSLYEARFTPQLSVSNLLSIYADARSPGRR